MLNDNIKELIESVVKLYSTTPLTQKIIDDGVEKLKAVKSLLTSSNSFVCNTVSEMRARDFKVGDIVTTLGYDSVGDNGNAKYEIMDYETWWNNIPNHVKFVHYHNDRIGCNPVLYRNPVDCYINHILDNGLVASLIKENNTIRVEQGGCIEGRKDNCIALRHIFAYNNTGIIEFGKDHKYELYYDSYNQCFDRESEIITDKPWWLGTTGNTGNEYALVLGCRMTTKPCLGRVKDLKLIGNNCTIHIPNNEFCKGGSDFAMFESGGIINGLEITGFNLDCNGLNQVGYYTEISNDDGTVTKQFNNMRTCNHTISYFSSGIREDVLSPVVDEYAIPHEDVCISLLGDTEFSNVNIHHNNFYSNGTIVDTSDGGGDHILIINPTKSENVFIENNYFENWGRWVFAVDLGGNGERFYNYKFNRNKCIQNEDNYIPRANGNKAYRGLGFIDFEARKCFTNLEVCDNYVLGANGWAFNGNGKISENIKIERNHIERPSYNWRSIYPYSFTFYSVYPKDLSVRHNTIIGGGVGFGNLAYNTTIENNDFINTGTVIIHNPFKNVIIKDNRGEGTRNQLFGLNVNSLVSWVTNEDSEFYVPEEERITKIVFENNGEGGMCGNIYNFTNDTYKSNISLIFKNNKFRKFNVNCFGIKDYQFTPDQLLDGITWSARGCKVSNPVVSLPVDNPVPGGLYYKPGDLVTSTLNNVTRLYNPKYFNIDFPQLKHDNGLIKKDMDMYCTKEGVFPLNGEFLMCEGDSPFVAGGKRDLGNFLYTSDNLYYVSVAGNLGDTEPTHAEGVATNGTCQLVWVAPIARYEMIEK